MAKPATGAEYSQPVTEACERVLVTLIRGLGPWKKSVYLIGGLTPRYLANPPEGGAAHVGTGDVDVVVELEMLAETDAYHTLEENLEKMGFVRENNAQGKPTNWRWRTTTEEGLVVILELLADNPKISPGKVEPLPAEGKISALNIPHSSMVFDHHVARDITAKLLNNGGVSTEEIRHADIVTFLCLKAFAFDDRHEGKDVYDIVYCLQNFEGGVKAAADKFNEAIKGKHADVIKKAIEILRKRFADDGKTEGYQKDGPVSAAKFEGITDGDARVLRQRQVSELLSSFLEALK